MSSRRRYGDKGSAAAEDGEEQECCEEWDLLPRGFAAIALFIRVSIAVQTERAHLNLNKHLKDVKTHFK